VALGSAGVSEFAFLNPVISAAVLVGVTVQFGGSRFGAWHSAVESLASASLASTFVTSL
jgi:hypothetical protein